MTLAAATLPDGHPLPFTEAPVPGEALRALTGVRFDLPCDDPWVREARGGAHTYLEAAAAAWKEHPEWMDFLDQESPAWDLKRAERDLYLHWLGEVDAPRVLDVGCGVGRFTQAFLDRGATVHACDGDLESLRRCTWHAAGRPGALDVHWTSTSVLPDVEVDLAIAVEVLCYVESPLEALRAIHTRLRPGGRLLLAMEARWGWATSQDAPSGGLEVALGAPGPLHLEGDRFVHLYDEPELRALVEAAGFTVNAVVPTHYLTDGPLEDLLPDPLTLETLMDLEGRCRQHPVWKPLNRIWTVTATR